MKTCYASINKRKKQKMEIIDKNYKKVITVVNFIQNECTWKRLIGIIETIFISLASPTEDFVPILGPVGQREILLIY